MPIGRPRIAGTEAERAEARRAQVRANVQAFRQRQKEKRLAENSGAVRKDDLCSIPARQHAGGKDLPVGMPISVPPPRRYADVDGSFACPPEDPDFWLWGIPAEMGARLEGTTYQDAFMQALEHRFAPSQRVHRQTKSGPQKRLLICGSTWTTSANLDLGRPETEVLMESLLAASLAVVGRDRGDSEMSLHGAYMQTRALQRLRFSLTRYREGDRSICPTMLSLTALTCAMSELIANKSWDNFNRHLLGVGALIFHGGVEVCSVRSFHNELSGKLEPLAMLTDEQGLNRRSAREQFYGYRAIQTPFLFMNRQRAFLSDSEWIDFPWKKDVEIAQDTLHSMLDIALKVLPEIVQQDMPKKWKIGCLEERLDKVRDIVEELDDWERQLRRSHHGVLYTKVPSTWGGAYQHCINFPDTSTAIAFAMYTAVRVHVAALVATISDEIMCHGPATNVDPRSAMLEAMRWSRLACQSVEYFHTGAPKVAGRIVTLWPLETAWELFSRVQVEGDWDVSQEIEWCQSAAERHAALGIPPFQWR